MKIVFYLIFTILTFLSHCTAQKWQTTDEWLNDAYSSSSGINLSSPQSAIDSNITSIELYFFDNGEVKGYYIDNACENKTQITGHILDKILSLNAYNGDTILGYFKGKIIKAPESNTFYIGTWQNNPSSKPISFRIYLEATPGALHHHSYDNYTPKTDEEVEAFVKQVKTAIITGNKEWLAAVVEYPFYFEVNDLNTRGIEIKDKQQFKINFDKYVTHSYREDMKRECIYELSSRWDGISFSTMWIKDGGPDGFFISSIFISDNYLK